LVHVVSFESLIVGCGLPEHSTPQRGESQAWRSTGIPRMVSVLAANKFSGVRHTP
jgi:hypothetical protein